MAVADQDGAVAHELLDKDEESVAQSQEAVALSEKSVAVAEVGLAVGAAVAEVVAVAGQSSCGRPAY